MVEEVVVAAGPLCGVVTVLDRCDLKVEVDLTADEGVEVEELLVLLGGEGVS